MYGLNRLSVCPGVGSVHVTMMVDSTHLATEPLLGPHLLGRQLAHRPLGTHSRLVRQAIGLHGHIHQLDYMSIWLYAVKLAGLLLSFHCCPVFIVVN